MSTAATALEGLLIRPAALTDIEAVADLINVCAIAEQGTPETSINELRRAWEAPGFNLETDTWVVTDPDAENRIVGYKEVWDIREPHTRLGTFGCVHPDYQGRGIGTRLMRLGEARARLAIAKAPPEARVSLGTGTITTNTAAKALFEQEGYTFTRRFWHMEIEMDAPPPAPVWPEGIIVRTHITGQDDQATYLAVEDSFADHWGHQPFPFELFKQYMLEDEHFDANLWFLAMAGDEIAGIALCFPKTIEDPNMGWIADLGVRRAYRRRGLGLALLHHAFGAFWQRGTRKVGLGVDSDSLTGATRLYERAGMRVTREYDRYEKELRPGVELSTQTLSE